MVSYVDLHDFGGCWKVFSPKYNSEIGSFDDVYGFGMDLCGRFHIHNRHFFHRCWIVFSPGAVYFDILNLTTDTASWRFMSIYMISEGAEKSLAGHKFVKLSALTMCMDS